MRSRLLSVVLSICCIASHGQDYPRSDLDMNRISDDLLGLQDEDTNDEESYENIMQLLSRPLDLNRAGAEDLHFLHILSASQIQHLLEYRETNGRLLSIYELQAVPEFDLESIYRLVPFVKVLDATSTLDKTLWSRLKNESDSYFLMRYERTLQSKQGDARPSKPASKFHGSPDKLYFRFRTSKPGEFSFGLTAEKDAGEAIKWSPKARRYGMDYISFHVQLQKKGRLKNLVVGDFQCQFAQGLMLGGVTGRGKGSETITTLRKSNIGLLPYTSAYESGSLRGMGATVELAKNLFFTSFYSRIRRDATSATDTVMGGRISAFQTSGLHRNDNELSTRRTITEENWGTVIQYQKRRFDAGVMFNNVTFGKPVLRNPTVYNYHAFQGKSALNVGLFINYELENFSFFNEYSHSIHSGSALISGVLCSLTPKLDLSLLYRMLSRDFYSFYSNAIAENTTTQNEIGMFWGWKYQFTPRIWMNGYVDLFRFPWLRFRSYAPSTGHEWLLRITFKPSRTVLIYAQGREESKARNIIVDDGKQYHIATGKKYNCWINLEYGLREKVRLKTRFQWSSYQIDGTTTEGVALIQDVRVQWGRFKITARYALFDTDDYDNRQYAYENDVFLAYSMPAYAGIGVRKMIMLEYKLSRQISIWMRYAHSRYPYEDNIGSGQDTIEGNIKNDVKFQLRFRI